MVKMDLVLVYIIMAIYVIFCKTSYGYDMNDINKTNILQQYVLVCGNDYLCDKSYFSQLPRLERDYRNRDVCPPCRCDILCLARGDCCPDKFLENSISKCQSVSVLSNNNGDNETVKFRMVNYCPVDASDEEKRKCERDLPVVDALTSFPVTVKDTLVIYKNKHCANCNGQLNYINWRLDFECKQFADFNFYSSYQEIIDEAKLKECNISFDPPEQIVTIGNCSFEYPYGKCNKTGLWEKYDSDIDWACSNYHNNYKSIFKNIFCYICNPSTTQNTNVIESCNVTGRISVFDQGLWDACKMQPALQVTFPFKNIFCYLCNTDGMLLDADISDIFENVDDSGFSYKINVNAFNIDYFSPDTPEDGDSNIMFYRSFSGSIANFRQEILIKNETSVNIPEMVFTYLAYTTHLPLCYPLPEYTAYMSHSRQSCECSDKCIFQNWDDCCVDLLFRYPFSCIGNQPFTHRKNKEIFYRMVDTCWRQNASSELKKKCENPDSQDILSVLPVRSANMIHFKNFYCFICNQEILGQWYASNLRMIDGKYEVWDLVIKCKTYLNYMHSYTLLSVITMAKLQNCQIKFEPKYYWYSLPICTVDPSLIENCPLSWEGSKSIKWACENMNHPVFPPVKIFKNMFCQICNSQSSINLINTCDNPTVAYDEYVEMACLTLPEVPVFLPYKNLFCRICNEWTTPAPETTPLTTAFTSKPPTTPYGMTTKDPGDVPPSTVTGSSFRSIFSLASYDRPTNTEENVLQTCNAYTQIYDQWKDVCRNKTCFPGKLLVNDSCIALFKITKNLGYILSFRLEAQTVVSNRTIDKILAMIKFQLQDALMYNIIGSDDVTVVSVYMLANKPCDVIMSNATENSLQIKIYARFYVHSFVDRIHIEKSLQESKNQTFKFVFEEDLMVFQSHEDVDSSYLPTLTSFAGFDQCILVETNAHYLISSAYYRSVHVTKLLLCNQIELTADEFRTDPLKHELHIISSSTSVPHGKFHLLKEGGARICLEDIPAYVQKQNFDSEAYVLEILTLVCTIISLCGLFITFVTYILFPILRTIPGKNNMALVFAIFFSQLLLQFGLKQTRNNETCIAVGILAHFFWLSMFGCMNVCSLHMFRVFRGINVPTDHRDDTKLMLKYLTLSYGVPALVVITNMAVHLGLTNGVDKGYGEGKCFISHKLSFILSFLAPLLIICVLNIIFFVITFYKIKTMPKLQTNKKDRNEVAIYLKLFTLTGILWLLQIVDSFFHRSVFSFIVTVLNGLQGLFIFISYICNKRVFELIREKFRKSKYAANSSTDSTTVMQTFTRQFTDSTKS